MTLSLAMITLDTTDPTPLARWWAEQTGAEITADHDGWYVVVSGGALPAMLAFQKVDDPTPGKNKLHLDFAVTDAEAEADRLIGAGASLVERRGDDAFRWITLADPQGNEFCISDQADA